MRKSSAPSLKTLSSVAKKRKFSTPFSNTSPTATAAQDASTMSDIETAANYQSKKKIIPEFSSRPLKNNKFGVTFNSSSKNISSKNSPIPSKTLPLISNNNDTSKCTSEDVSKDVMEKYFEVVW